MGGQKTEGEFMTYYIGIDQSYRSTGVVALDANGNLITHDVIGTLKSDGDYFSRASMAAEMIASKVISIASGDSHTHLIGAPDVVVGLEGLAFGMRGHTLQNLAGLQFMIVNALRVHGLDVTIQTPSRVKKFATGKGRCGKEEMFEALPENIKGMFSKVTKTNGREDLTDAYHIAKLLIQEPQGFKG